MQQHIFKLKASSDYISLDKLLKIMQMVSSGGEAHAVIAEGKVKVNGETATQKRKKIRLGDIVDFEGHLISIKTE